MINFVRLLRKLRRRKAFGAGCISLFLLIAILGNTTCFYFFERRADPAITLSDSLWYSVISVTTIGYGDFSATTVGARLGTVFFIVVVGLAAFTVFVGWMIDGCATWLMRSEMGMGTVQASGHVLLVHFPAATRVKGLIEELQSDPHYRGREIVVVANQIDRLPFSLENVLFIHGSPLEAETYRRARIEDAELALVLASSYSDSNSDALASSAVSVIDRLKPSIHIVAECLDDRHRELFEAVRCDAIVPGMKIAGNLLVQEMFDPGITRMVEAITSNLVGATLFSTRVDRPAADLTYGQFAAGLLQHNINVLGIDRGGQPVTTFGPARPEEGDLVIYIAAERRRWMQLEEMSR